MMKKSELVAAARDRLADPSRWTKRACARNPEGCAVAVNSPRAASWCVTGALAREARLHDVSLADKINRKTVQVIGEVFREQHPDYFEDGVFPVGHFDLWVEAFNDDSRMTHADLLSVLDKAYVNLVERGE